MLTGMEYVRQSIELNLFFLRVIKEHFIFAAAALTFRDANMIPSMMEIKNRFEQLLLNTVSLANGVIGPDAITAGDIVTPFTYNAEVKTQFYTGLQINTDITRMEAELARNSNMMSGQMLESAVNMLNQQIIAMLNVAIQSKKMLLANVVSCKMFIHLYPLLLEHVTHEAEHYLQHLMKLQMREDPLANLKDAAMIEEFWNHIMEEHAKFIRGYLDPTEEELINKANGFAGEFEELTEAARRAVDRVDLLPAVTAKSIAATENISDFKRQGTMGILECRVRSIILPLLSDHVLREANHFLKVLRKIKMLRSR